MKPKPTAAQIARLSLAPLVLMCLASPASAQRLVFDEAEIFFELNNTDEDLGIHGLIDGDAWRNLLVTDPLGQKVLHAWVRNRLRRQGLTEFFFESAEPTFDDLPPSRFFNRFPAGDYMLRARSVDGFVFNEETTLTHVMPAPPAPTVNGQPMSTDCDDEEPGYAPTEVTAPVTIAWPEVTMSHPDADGGGAGVQPPVPVTIHNYGLVVEFDAENPDPQGDELEVVMEIILPPWQTEATVPEEILDLGEEFKYEVLAREESFNQTAVESCFVVVEP